MKSKHVNVDYNNYFSNKLTIVYETLESQIKDIYLYQTKRNCENQISIIKKQLSLAFIAPEQFAHNLMGPRFTSQLPGNVIHIIKCQPIEITINPNPKNYNQDIPMLYHNKSVFMSFTSGIIIKLSRKIKCNRITPVQFRVNGNWIKFTPTLKFAKAPKRLGPHPQENFKLTEIRDLEGRGMYAQEELEDY